MSAALPFASVPGPMQRRFGAVVLASQAPVLLFGALAIWGLASAQGDDRSGFFLGAGLAITALALVAAAMLRRPFGVTLGWIVQVLTLLIALLAPVAVIVGVIFGGLWITALVQGRKMDELTARHQAELAAETPSER